MRKGVNMRCMRKKEVHAMRTENEIPCLVQKQASPNSPMPERRPSRGIGDRLERTLEPKKLREKNNNRKSDRPSPPEPKRKAVFMELFIGFVAAADSWGEGVYRMG
jgi:hypothetical protein